MHAPRTQPIHSLARSCQALATMGLIASGLLPLPSCATTGAPEVSAALDRIAVQIFKDHQGQQARVLAILPFTDLEGQVTQLHKYVAEELTTRLFGNVNFRVVERSRIEQVLGEVAFGGTAAVDVDSAAQFGRLLGADAIVTGTITDLGESLALNARIIEVATGNVIGVAAVKFAKDQAVGRLLGQGVAPRPGQPGGPGPDRPSPPEPAPPAEHLVALQARSTSDGGVFARLELWADGRPVTAWDTGATVATYTAAVPAQTRSVSAVFVNDRCSACSQEGSEDRNLEVVSLEVDGHRFQAGSAELAKLDCAGYTAGPRETWLYCDLGRLTVPVPAAGSQRPGPERVAVRARGSWDAGSFPNLRLFVNGRLARSWLVTEAWATYVVDSLEPVGWVQVNFDNDSCTACNGAPGGGDRNLEVDWVEIGSQRLDMLGPGVRVQDCRSRDGSTVTGGPPRSKTLLCADAGFLVQR